MCLSNKGYWKWGRLPGWGQGHMSHLCTFLSILNRKLSWKKKIWESSTDMYTLPYVKYRASGSCCVTQGAQLHTLWRPAGLGCRWWEEGRLTGEGRHIYIYAHMGYILIYIWDIYINTYGIHIYTLIADLHCCTAETSKNIVKQSSSS